MMKPEQLAEIRRRIDRATEDGNGSSADAYMKRDARKDITALLAEVKRLNKLVHELNGGGVNG